MKNRNPMKGKGKGSVHQRRDGWWVGQWSNGFDKDGRRVRKSVYAKSEGEARRRLDEFINMQAGRIFN